MMDSILDVILANSFTIVLAVLAAIAFYFYNGINYWKNLGITCSDKTVPYFGNAKDVIFGKVSLGEKTVEIYREMKEKGAKFAGGFMPFPVFIPIDPELIKSIMQKDFNYFVNRGVYYNEKDDPMSAHLFAIEDQKWRNLRAKLTPTFTSGKMKMMFSTVLDTNKQLKEVLDKVEDGTPLEIKDILARLNTDIIGSCAFGLDCNSLKDPEADFRKHGKNIFKFSFLKSMKRLITLGFPNVSRKFGLIWIDQKVSKFFMNAIEETVAYRENNNIFRKDFMHLMIQLKNKGRVTDDESLHVDNSNTEEKSNMKVTLNEIAAQAFVFFIAGFETSSTTMTYALYELGINQTMQDKLREEVNRITKKYNGELTYEGVMEMHYMEKIINETLRKYPTLPILNRCANMDYKLPNTNITLKKGTKVFIPVEGLHHDEEYYPNPKKFDPERFSEELKQKRHPFTYLPFGEGPRVCIGLRFGMLQTKVGLAILLQNYRITLDPKTSIPLKRDPKQFLNGIVGGIWINIEKIKSTE